MELLLKDLTGMMDINAVQATDGQLQIEEMV